MNTIEASPAPLVQEAEEMPVLAPGLPDQYIESESGAQILEAEPAERTFTWKGETCTESQLREKCPYLNQLGEAAFNLAVKSYAATEQKEAKNNSQQEAIKHEPTTKVQKETKESLIEHDNRRISEVPVERKAPVVHEIDQVVHEPAQKKADPASVPGPAKIIEQAGVPHENELPEAIKRMAVEQDELVQMEVADKEPETTEVIGTSEKLPIEKRPEPEVEDKQIHEDLKSITERPVVPDQTTPDDHKAPAAAMPRTELQPVDYGSEEIEGKEIHFVGSEAEEVIQEIVQPTVAIETSEPGSSQIDVEVPEQIDLVPNSPSVESDIGVDEVVEEGDFAGDIFEEVSDEDEIIPDTSGTLKVSMPEPEIGPPIRPNLAPLEQVKEKLAEFIKPLGPAEIEITKIIVETVVQTSLKLQQAHKESQEITVEIEQKLEELCLELFEHLGVDADVTVIKKFIASLKEKAETLSQKDIISGFIEEGTHEQKPGSFHVLQAVAHFIAAALPAFSKFGRFALRFAKDEAA